MQHILGNVSYRICITGNVTEPIYENINIYFTFIELQTDSNYSTQIPLRHTVFTPGGTIHTNRDGNFWVVVNVKSSVKGQTWLLIGCLETNGQSGAKLALWPNSWHWLQLKSFHPRAASVTFVLVFGWRKGGNRITSFRCRLLCTVTSVFMYIYL